MFKVETLDHMLRDFWSRGSLVPFSHGSKVPSTTIFALRVITKKYTVSVLNVLHIINFFLEHITFARNLSEKLLVICKNKKTHAPKFYFHPSKSKLPHKNWFDSHSSFETHMGNKKAISASLPKPQEHTFTRWRETAYGHWAHPGIRSHISPMQTISSLRSY